VFRNHRDEKEKELIRFFDKYDELWRSRKDSGTWVDVEPYQQGWIRKFELRDDAKNRSDAAYMRQVLDMVNVTKYSRRQDFKFKNWKTGQWENMPQRLKHISVEKYDKLTEKLKSYFGEVYRFEKYSKKIIREFAVRNDFYYVYAIEPNIVTQHWIPDAEVESLLGEMNEKINRNNLWPKLAKVRGHTVHYKDWRLTPYMKNKLGEMVDEKDFDVEVDE
jgi:hypothetical protein